MTPVSTSFRTRVLLVWVSLALVLVAGAAGLGLKVPLILEKLPFLAGFRLTPNGFVQGAALTVLVTAVSMVFAFVLGVLTALGRLSRNPVAFGLATFYASFFRGTSASCWTLSPRASWRWR